MQRCQDRIASFARGAFESQLKRWGAHSKKIKGLLLWDQKVDPDVLCNTYVEQGIVSSDIADLFRGVASAKFCMSPIANIYEVRNSLVKSALMGGVAVVSMGLAKLYIHQTFTFFAACAFFAAGIIFGLKGFVAEGRKAKVRLGNSR